MLRQLIQLRPLCTGMLALGVITFAANTFAEETRFTLDQIIVGDRQPTPTTQQYIIGLSASEKSISKSIRAQLPQLKGQGLLVQYVAKKSPAQKAKIKQYDILLTANKVSLKTVQDLQNVVRKAGKAKKSVTIEFLRAGKQQSVKLKPVLSNSIKQTFDPSEITEENISIPMFKKMFPQFDSDKITIVSRDNNGSEIRITKTGDSKPRKIIVTQKEGKVYKVTEKELDKLPADVRKDVQKALKMYKIHKRSLYDTPFSKDANRNAVDMAKMFNMGFHHYNMLKDKPAKTIGKSSFNKQLTEMNKQIKALTKAIEKLNKKLDEK